MGGAAVPIVLGGVGVVREEGEMIRWTAGEMGIYLRGSTEFMFSSVQWWSVLLFLGGAEKIIQEHKCLFTWVS